MKPANPRTLGSLILAIAVIITLGLSALKAPSPVQSSSNTLPSSTAVQNKTSYKFRTNELREKHFQKHGMAMGFSDSYAYETAASLVVTNPASLHKLEKEDGDDVYYLESTDEFVIVSTSGFIRTYFNPGGIDYYNRQ